MKSWRRRWPAWVAWSTVLAVTHLVLLSSREPNGRQSHVVLIFLLVVLGGSAAGAPGLGTALALAGFALIDYSYQRPFGTFTVAKSIDWVVLTAFLATAMVATALVHRARAAAAEAEARADEVLALSASARRAAALEDADRMKDALLTSVSHDLRTPLTTIRALASDPGSLQAASSEIVAQVDRLDHMVRNILDFSRAASGLSSVPEANAADDLIGAALRQCAARLRGHIVKTETAPGDVLVGHFDFEQGLRALTNLVENAAKYSPAGSEVHIVAYRENASLAIDVRDRGPGIQRDEEERIFVPFYRPPGSPPDAGSSGLGLAIARRIAEAQGGTVTYRAREGGGSVFTFGLPLRATDNAG